LVTNGILLPKQSEKFWQICKNNNIQIFVSDYPVKLDKKVLKKTAEDYGVMLKLGDEQEAEVFGNFSQWAKIPLDVLGKQNYKKSFGNCFISGSCFQLVKGRIYKCARIAYAKHFNKTFGKNLSACQDDYINIYEAENIDEILGELTKPAPFCRYCKSGEISWTNKWSVSKKDINEWI
jgi:hypothetical protein